MFSKVRLFFSHVPEISVFWGQHRMTEFFQKQLHDILQNSTHAEQLYGALHNEFRTAVEKQSSGTNKRVKSRGFQAINKRKK